MWQLMLLAPIFLVAANNNECVNKPSSDNDIDIFPKDRRMNQKELKIATLNANFLFSKPTDKIDCPGVHCPWRTQVDMIYHLQAMARVLKKMDADIVLLTEVQGCDALSKLIQEINDKTYRAYLVPGNDATTEQNVAIITRIDPVEELKRTSHSASYPIVDSSCESDRQIRPGKKGLSKNIIARFLPVGFDRHLLLFGIHLISRRMERLACFQREAQAQVVQDTIGLMPQDDHVVVLGDFNAFDGRVKDVWQSVPTSRAVEIIKAAGTGLVNVAKRTPRRHRYTHWNVWCKDGVQYPSAARVQSLDHVLVSARLNQRIKRVHFAHEYYKPMTCNNIFTDHFPIIVTINTRKRYNSN